MLSAVAAGVTAPCCKKRQVSVPHGTLHEPRTAVTAERRPVDAVAAVHRRLFCTCAATQEQRHAVRLLAEILSNTTVEVVMRLYIRKWRAYLKVIKMCA